MVSNKSLYILIELLVLLIKFYSGIQSYCCCFPNAVAVEMQAEVRHGSAWSTDITNYKLNYSGQNIILENRG